MRIHGRRSATWTRETDLPETVVKLFDSNSRTQSTSQEKEQKPIETPTDAGNDGHEGNWCEKVFATDQ